MKSHTNPDGTAMMCGVRINVLPDFLLDHTLLPERIEERLEEQGEKWTQFLRRLWIWQGCTFCFRFVADPTRRSTTIFLLARPAKPELREMLQRDLEFALTAYGVVTDIRDPIKCVPLVHPDEILRAPLSNDMRIFVRERIKLAFAPALQALPDSSRMVGITQLVSGNLWVNRPLLKQVRDVLEEEAKAEAARAGEREPPPIFSAERNIPKIEPWITHLWEGPAGPFLLPFRALAAARTPVILSIYAEPCHASWFERRWFELLRTKAGQAMADPARQEPGADLFGRLATKLQTRVLQYPWLIASEVAALSGSLSDALSVASSIHSLCQEAPRAVTGTLDDPLPAARLAEVDELHLPEARTAHNRLDFPRWMDDRSRPKELRRIDYLADARAAATLFRLPVSVRGGIPGIEVEQPPPDFIPGPRHQHADPDSLVEEPTLALRNKVGLDRKLCLGRYESGGRLLLDVKQLSKHALVTGFTGSGKTTTVLNILHELWHLSPGQGKPHTKGPNGGGIPFLVIESAKHEYRGLLGVEGFCGSKDGLLIFTLGNETCAPFRLNPFALLPGIRVEAHVSRIQACFEAALPPLPFLPSLLAESLDRVYKKFWWTMTDKFDPATRAGRRFPRIIDFYEMIERVIIDRKYGEGETKQNIVAATKGRLKQLLMGSVGFMLSEVDESFDIVPEILMERPVILEMNDLNLQDKALMMMFILTLVREYRELHHSDSLVHVTVVEEAHNVLGQVESQGTGEGAGADTRAKSVEAFCNMLAEVRSIGEGLIISDQSPNKLAADAMRNTNVQIAHQLRDSRDREAIAAAMIMDEEQRDFLGKLAPGRAAVFYTGLQKATFVTSPDYKSAGGSGFSEQLDDPVVERHMAPLMRYKRQDTPFPGCKYCPKRRTCDYRPAMMAIAHSLQPTIQTMFREGIKLIGYKPTRGLGTSRIFAAVHAATSRTLLSGNADAGWCLFLHVWSELRAAASQELRPGIHSHFLSDFHEMEKNYA